MQICNCRNFTLLFFLGINRLCKNSFRTDSLFFFSESKNNFRSTGTLPHRRPQPRSERSSETANTPAHGSWRRRVKLLQVVPLWSDHTEIMRSTDAGSNLSQSRCSSSRMLIPWSPLPIASALVVDLTLTQHARPFLWRSGQRRDQRVHHRTRRQAPNPPPDTVDHGNEEEARRSRWLVEAKLDSSAKRVQQAQWNHAYYGAPPTLRSIRGRGTRVH